MITKERVKTAIFIVLWLSFFGVIVGTSPSFQACVGEHYHHEAGDSLQKGAACFIVMSKGFAPCLGEFVHKNAEAIIALFTIILGIATWLLWRATDRLVRGADKNAERQLRAYVLVHHAEMIERILDEQQSAASVTFKNYGQTPARHATVWLETRICDLPLVDTDFAFEGAKKRTPKCTIGPSGEIAKNAKMPKLPGGTEQAILPEKQTLAMFGRIDYVDAFDEPRWTDFRLILVKDVAAGFSFIPSEAGNDTY
jgi:hypothetical protein